MSTINLGLYNALRKGLNLTEENSQYVAQAIQDTVAENVAEKEATAKELVSKELIGVATKADIANLEIKMAENKADIIKWMFLFWVGQLGATFGLLYFFIKK